MNDQIQIWNLLHDGEITAISQENDTLVMFVNIPYLRRRIKPLGDSFVVIMKGISTLEFHDFDGRASDFQEEIEIGTPEILSTASESMPISIDTTMGKLVIAYEEITYSLDTGQPIEYAEIENQCNNYWKEWEEKSK